MSATAIESLEIARFALKDPMFSEAEVNVALGNLAGELGTTRPERGTLVAMRAVIDKLERPEVFPRDQDAWEMHGAKPRSFKTWKQRINGLVLSMAVDMLVRVERPTSAPLCVTMGPGSISPHPALLSVPQEE